MEIDAFFRNVPKVELHAHLSGCVRPSTIVEMLLQQEETLALQEYRAPLRWKSEWDVLKSDHRSCRQCFDIFRLIHGVLVTRDLVARVTKEVIFDFANDCVMYLELRSTPRALRDATKVEYVDIMISAANEAINELSSKGIDIIVKFILSIDRRNSLEDAMDTVNLAKSFNHRGVVGLCFSGDPLVSSFSSFIDVFKFARDSENPLRITVHVAETYNEHETAAILSFRPDRLGHATCLNQENLSFIVESKIPVETCLTSNLLSGAIDSLKNHPLHTWLRFDVATCMCTDDTGVFNTSSSKEYMLLNKEFGLTLDECVSVIAFSIKIIFDDSLVSTLEEKLLTFCSVNGFKIPERRFGY